MILAAATAFVTVPVLGFASAAAQTGTPATPVAQDTTPRYQPPLRGAPRGRISGASRGAGNSLGRLDVLAPDHVGWTGQDQPTLYWFNTYPVRQRAQLTITTADSDKPLLEINLPQPVPAGINSFALADTPIRLQTDIEYEWSVAIITNAAERSNDVMAGGIIQRVTIPGPADRAARASAGQAARLYAEGGLWYDAIDVLSRAIARSPSDANLRRARASLLEQVGLNEAAAFDGQAIR
jgi:hypothetical protein